MSKASEALGIAMGAAVLLVTGFCGGWLVGIHADDEAPLCHSKAEDSLVMQECEYRNGAWYAR